MSRRTGGLESLTAILGVEPPSTQRANARDQRYFDAWRAIAFPDVPLEALDETVILTFILHHVERRPEALVSALTAQGWRVTDEGLSVRTVRRYLASVSVWLDSRGWPNPLPGPAGAPAAQEGGADPGRAGKT